MVGLYTGWPSTPDCRKEGSLFNSLDSCVADLDPKLPNICMVATCTWRNTSQTLAVIAHCPLPVAACYLLYTQCTWPVAPQSPQGRRGEPVGRLREEGVWSAQAWQQTLTCSHTGLWLALSMLQTWRQTDSTWMLMLTNSAVA